MNDSGFGLNGFQNPHRSPREPHPAGGTPRERNRLESTDSIEDAEGTFLPENAARRSTWDNVFLTFLQTFADISRSSHEFTQNVRDEQQTRVYSSDGNNETSWTLESPRTAESKQDLAQRPDLYKSLSPRVEIPRLPLEKLHDSSK